MIYAPAAITDYGKKFGGYRRFDQSLQADTARSAAEVRREAQSVPAESQRQDGPGGRGERRTADEWGIENGEGAAAGGSPERPKPCDAGQWAPTRGWNQWQRVGGQAGGQGERAAEPATEAGAAGHSTVLEAAGAGELSLDSVQVIRNDLSDSDLEVVTAPRRPGAPGNGAVPEGKAPLLATILGTPSGGSALGRMSARLFGADRTST